MNTITVDELIQSLEKNGLKQSFATSFRNIEEIPVGYPESPYGEDIKKIVYACATGQMAINTGIDGYNIDDFFSNTFQYNIVANNDIHRKSFAEIAAELREVVGARINEEIVVNEPEVGWKSLEFERS